MSTWIIAGLGNPGSQYQRTRHNIGQMVIDLLADGISFSAHKSRCEIAVLRSGENQLILAKSKLYMNESGAPIKALADFYKITANNLIIAHDELDLPFGDLRVKQGGGDNGHNGLKDLTRHFGPDYFRLRLGIGRPPGMQPTADFVLKPFSAAESAPLKDLLIKGAQATDSLIQQGLAKTQSLYNS
jgi:PTH1 family peptidyl-tRNA hydrolase